MSVALEYVKYDAVMALAAIIGQKWYCTKDG